MASGPLIRTGIRFPNPQALHGSFSEWDGWFYPRFYDCGLQGVVDLSDLTGLQYFCASMNGITALLNHKNLPIRMLDIGANNLSGTFDASGMTTLEWLAVGGNSELTDIDLTNCTALSFLIVDMAGITVLDVGDCGQLRDVYASDCNRLATIEGLADTQVTTAYFWGCALPESEVDGVLEACVLAGQEYGYCDLSGGTNAPPSAQGENYKTILESRSWSVTVNT